MAKLNFEAEELRSLVEMIAEVFIEKMQQQHKLLNCKMALSEIEAAKLLGLNHWQLGHERKEGKIEHVRTVGNKIRYTPDQIAAYLKKQSQSGN